MTQRRIPVAREGWPFIAVPGALALGLALAGRRGLALPFGAAALASLGFFRDPERAIPTVPNAVLAPADGRVMAVEEIDDPFVGRAVRVVIFLSPLDVHVNRAPIAGLVVETVRTRGRYVAAYEPEAGEVNERCAIHLQGESARVKVVQIVGVVARRIVCRVAAGDKVAAGDRIGMIRFGSRTDCYVPTTTALRVRAGDTVRGASSILGVLA
jgi:phosphatidylserine decarboxylase